MKRTRVVATIGVFDGIHRGHRALIERVLAGAASARAVPVAITFDPSPETVLRGRAAARITPAAEQAELLAGLGVARVLIVRFSRAVARLSPEEFIARFLLSRWDLVGLVVGYDFRFGRGGSGDAGTLRRLGKASGFWVERLRARRFEREPISSTRVRETLARGDVAAAARMLGRRFAVSGRVIRGRALGTRALVPTANVRCAADQLLPARGVYLVEVTAPGLRRAGVAKVGPSPTTGHGSERLVEVHLLDYSGDIRGRELRVHFIDWIRAERRFTGLAELRRAIAGDIRGARRRLGRPIPAPAPGRPARRPAGRPPRGPLRGRGGPAESPCLDGIPDASFPRFEE